MISENDNIRTNSTEAWILAARPKTLTGASVPVMIGVALAIKTAQWNSSLILPAILCFIFAFSMQIDSNLINDYFDCIHGNDDTSTRLGPKRACAEGWITLPVMKRPRRREPGSVLFRTAADFLRRMGDGYRRCFMRTFRASSTPRFFSYKGLGDLLVLIFFGIVPVYFTWWVCVPEELQQFNPTVLGCGIACGLVIDTLLLVNNYRDRDNDKRDGKMTLVVRIGIRNTEKLYLYLPTVAEIIVFLCLATAMQLTILEVVIFLALASLYFIPHSKTTRKLIAIKKGKALNMVLGMTARDMFLFGIMTAVQIILIYEP